MKLVAVFAGGGRPGRYAIDFRDAIQTPSRLADICDRRGFHRPAAPLFDFIYAMMAPTRIIEVGPRAYTGGGIWAERFPHASTVLPFASDQVDVAVPSSVRWMWRRVVMDHGEALFDLIVDSTQGGAPTLLAESWPMMRGLYLVERVPQDKLVWWKDFLAPLPLRGVGLIAENGEAMILLEQST